MANNLSNLNNLAGGLTNLNVFNNLNSLNELNLSSLSNLNQISNLLINENAMLQQQQQPVSPSQQPRSSNISPNNNMFNNFNQYQQLVNGAGNGSIDSSAIHNLNQLMMSKKPSENGNEPSNYPNGNGMQQQQQQRELGVIEKIVGSYGFVKCLSRDYRLYFHLNSYQNANNEPKVGDLVEFEEGYDKRNGKPCAINLIRHERAGSAQSQFNLDSPLNLMNLKELLHKNSSGGENGQVYKQQQQQNFQYLMSGLKMLNMQQGLPNGSISNGYESLQNANNDTAVNNLNSIMGLFNKENVTGNMSQNQAINNNILSMAKALAANNASAAAAAGLNTSSFNESDGLKKNDIISNEVMEGIVAIPAMKRTVNNLYVSF